VLPVDEDFAGSGASADDGLPEVRPFHDVASLAGLNDVLGVVVATRPQRDDVIHVPGGSVRALEVHAEPAAVGAVFDVPQKIASVGREKLIPNRVSGIRAAMTRC